MKEGYLKIWMSRLRSTGFLRLALSPFASLVINPIILFRSLYNYRVILGKNHQMYNGGSAAIAFNHVFYWIQAVNFQRHGRSGMSNTLGCGSYDMSRLWFQTPFSIMASYRLGGAATNLLGMSIWIISHFVYLSDKMDDTSFLLITIFLALFSNNFYGNLFGNQNYNVLGWALLPVILWAMLDHQLWIVMAGCLAVSFLSITVYTLAVPLYIALYHDSTILLILIPGILRLAYSFSAVLSDRIKTFRYLGDILGIIGTLKKKYTRPKRIIYPLVTAAFFSLFPITVILTDQSFSGFSNIELTVLSFIPVGFFFINESRILRIADPQTCLLLFFTVSTAVTLKSSSYLLLGIYWVTNSNFIIAILLFRFDYPLKDIILHAPVVRPFNIAPYLDRIKEFIKPAGRPDRIFLAFNDPGTSYNEIFDGFHGLYELLHYCAALEEIHTLPDWYAILETNDEGAPNFWGRTPEEVRKNMDIWNAEYGLIYELRTLSDEQEWKNQGLEVVSVFHWETFRRDLGNSIFFYNGWPTWKLLRKT